MEINGGFAQRNAVSFLNDEYVSTSKMLKNGKIKNEIKKKKVPKIRTPSLTINLFLNLFSEIPKKFYAIVLGISVLIGLFILVFMQNVDTKTMDINNPNIFSNILNIFVFVIFIRFYLGKEHGAEHKIYNAGKETKVSEKLECLNHVKKYSRVTKNCGSRLYFTLITLQLISMFLFNNLFINLIIIEAVLQFDYRIGLDKIKPINSLNMFLQKHIFTREPDEKQLRIAIDAYINLKDKG